MQSIEIRRTNTVLNGVADVTIQPTPAAGHSAAVLTIRVSNLDSAAVTAILKQAGLEIDRITGIPAGVCDRSLCSREQPIHLVAGDEPLTIALDSAVATAQPIVRVAYLDATDSV